MADRHDEYIKALKDYKERFKSTFPTYGFWGTAEETIACVESCLREGKDIYEMGYLPDPVTIPGIEY